MSQTVIILAGGLGTRLKHLIPGLPKSLAPIAGKPFLAYQLEYLKKYSISDLILSVGYLSRKIISYFGNSYEGITITYVVEEEPLGTGGAILKASGTALSEQLLVLNGDTIFEVDFNSMFEEHIKSRADISIALLKVPDAGRYGSISVSESSQIINFSEKDPNNKEGFINGGIYLINKSFLNSFNLPAKFSIERELFPQVCRTHNIHGFISSGYFLDIGIPADYYKAQTDFKTLFTN